MFMNFSVPSLYKKWDDFHGVSMSALAKQFRTSKYNKPEIINVQAEDVLGSDEVALCWINLKEDTVSDLDSYSIQHVVGMVSSIFTLLINNLLYLHIQ